MRRLSAIMLIPLAASACLRVPAAAPVPAIPASLSGVETTDLSAYGVPPVTTTLTADQAAALALANNPALAQARATSARAAADATVAAERANPSLSFTPRFCPAQGCGNDPLDHRRGHIRAVAPSWRTPGAA